MMKPISLKIEKNQLKLLEALAKETHIPKSRLIREGIDMLIKEDKELLKKLTK